MVSAISASLSGLYAASKKLEVASSNIANQFSTNSLENGQKTGRAYQPQDVVSISQEAGGVIAQVRTVSQPTVKQYAPDSAEADASGMIDTPNVNLEKELTNALTAKYEYKANLKALQVADEILGDTLDIIS